MKPFYNPVVYTSVLLLIIFANGDRPLRYQCSKFFLLKRFIKIEIIILNKKNKVSKGKVNLDIFSAQLFNILTLFNILQLFNDIRILNKISDLLN